MHFGTGKIVTCCVARAGRVVRVVTEQVERLCTVNHVLDAIGTFLNTSVQRHGKKHRLVVEVESIASSWKKITTRRREGVGVVVEKNEESRRT